MYSCHIRNWIVANFRWREEAPKKKTKHIIKNKPKHLIYRLELNTIILSPDDDNKSMFN